MMPPSLPGFLTGSHPWRRCTHNMPGISDTTTTTATGRFDSSAKMLGFFVAASSRKWEVRLTKMGGLHCSEYSSWVCWTKTVCLMIFPVKPPQIVWGFPSQWSSWPEVVSLILRQDILGSLKTSLKMILTYLNSIELTLGWNNLHKTQTPRNGKSTN